LTWELLQDLLLIVAWVGSVIVIGMIIYIISKYNPWENLPKGFNYYLEALKSMPWELIIILFTLVIVIYFILKHINFAYRINQWGVFGVIIVSLAVGYAIAEKIGIHENIAKAPVAKNIYARQGKIFLVSRGVIITGEIKGTENNSLVIVDDDNHKWYISWQKNTLFPDGKKFSINELIKINGMSDKPDHINALIIRKVNENLRGFFEKVHSRTLIPCPTCVN